MTSSAPDLGPAPPPPPWPEAPAHDRTEDLAELAAGLSQPQKEIPSKYFYDRRGSALFDQITRLPEYYLTRAEGALLARWTAAPAGPGRFRALVELGAGSARKTEPMLQGMLARHGAACYVPIDSSDEYLAGTAARLRAMDGRLEVLPVVGDFSRELALPARLPRPVLFAFLGSTIGNFPPAGATRVLRRIAARLGDDDRLLLGVDLHKNPAVLHDAYNDAAGLTASFNLNALRVVNRRFGGNFVEEAFEHLAFYDSARRRIEMHLRSVRPQVVDIPGLAPIRFDAGETVRTEISCKYDRAGVERIACGAGLIVRQWQVGSDGSFALAELGPAA